MLLSGGLWPKCKDSFGLIRGAFSPLGPRSVEYVDVEGVRCGSEDMLALLVAAILSARYVIRTLNQARDRQTPSTLTDSGTARYWRNVCLNSTQLVPIRTKSVKRIGR